MWYHCYCVVNISMRITQFKWIKSELSCKSYVWNKFLGPFYTRKYYLGGLFEKSRDPHVILIINHGRLAAKVGRQVYYDQIEGLFIKFAVWRGMRSLGPLDLSSTPRIRSNPCEPTCINNHIIKIRCLVFDLAPKRSSTQCCSSDLDPTIGRPPYRTPNLALGSLICYLVLLRRNGVHLLILSTQS
jgi:hypothetical protein